jgi:hypothetical protein
VVLGALFSGMAVASVANCPMPRIWYLALPLAVWVVYTADHLLDARKLGEQAHTLRHHFHHQYFKPIAAIWLLSFLSCISWIMWLAGPDLRVLAMAAGGLVLGHLGLVALVGSRRSFLIIKELGVALIYTVGVWGGPSMLCQNCFTPLIYGLAGHFFLLAFINLIIFSLFEAKTDLRDGHSSWVLGMGIKRTRRIIKILIGFALGLGVAIAFRTTGNIHWLALTQLLMLILLASIVIFPKIFSKNNRYRLLGDGVFLLPVVVVLMEKM